MLTEPAQANVAAPPMRRCEVARPGNAAYRERIPWQVFLSFMLIPLSSIMFPHMSIMCFTAKKVTAFKKTVVLYPLCIMAIWLPCCIPGRLQPAWTRDMAGESEELATWLSLVCLPRRSGSSVGCCCRLCSGRSISRPIPWP
jgi:hypothetical protein